MSYENKYLKYKTKYLNLKIKKNNFKSLSEIDNLSDTVSINDTRINDLVKMIGGYNNFYDINNSYGLPSHLSDTLISDVSTNISDEDVRKKYIETEMSLNSILPSYLSDSDIKNKSNKNKTNKNKEKKNIKSVKNVIKYDIDDSEIFNKSSKSNIIYDIDDSDIFNTSSESDIIDEYVFDVNTDLIVGKNKITKKYNKYNKYKKAFPPTNIDFDSDSDFDSDFYFDSDFDSEISSMDSSDYLIGSVF